MKKIDVDGGNDKNKGNIVKTINIEKLIFNGNESISAFVRSSKIPLSLETVRRAAKNGDINTFTLFLILKYLGLSLSEIKEYLELAGDKELHPFLGGDQPLTPDEDALLSCYRKIKQIRPSFEIHIGDFLKMSSDMAGIDLSETIAIIKGEK